MSDDQHQCPLHITARRADQQPQADIMNAVLDSEWRTNQEFRDSFRKALDAAGDSITLQPPSRRGTGYLDRQLKGRRRKP